MCVYARYFVQCYRTHYIKFRFCSPDKGAFYTDTYIVYKHVMCIIQHYITGMKNRREFFSENKNFDK